MLRHTAAAAALMALTATTWTAGQAPRSGDVTASIEANKERYAAIAGQIWGYAELGFQEERSSALRQSTLADAGFAVTNGVAGMPTAFTASYGTARARLRPQSARHRLRGARQGPFSIATS